MQILLAEARKKTDRAKREGRELSDTELAFVEGVLAKGEGFKTRQRVNRVGGAITVGSGDDIGGKSAGKMVAEAVRKTRRGSAAWTTGPVELEGFGGKALIATADSGALIQPDVTPGIQAILTQPPRIADLCAQATTASNTVQSMVEDVATNAAAGVAEGAAKPESTLSFDAVDEPVKKIATHLPVTDEMLEDAAGLEGYVNARLAMFVRDEEDDQLLNGVGGNDLSGIIDRLPAANEAVRSSIASPNDIDHIKAGLAKVRESFLEPSAIVLHPDDWDAIVGLKDANAAYLAGNPFSSDFGQRLFGKQVVLSTRMTKGQALVGAFSQGAIVYRRSGITVETSNSHASNFVENKTQIRAEERLALAVPRPAAFARVDLGLAGLIT